MIRFDKGLRGSALKPYPAGYSAPSTDDVNKEDPTFQLGGIKDEGVWLSGQSFPAVIELSVRLNFIWIGESPSTLVQLGDHAPIALYVPMGALASVQVIYAGTGRYQKNSGDDPFTFVGARLSGDTLELPTLYLYQKDFPHQLPGQSIHWVSQFGSRGVILPLWAYGGRKVEDDVHPFVFTVEGVRQETSLTPTSLLYWREQGITPPQRGWTGREEVVFQDIFSQEQIYSFQESIEAGRATIRLQCGTDEQGKMASISYHSFRLSKNWLSFKQGECL